MATDVVDSASLKILSLNISGLRNKTKHILYLINKYKPDFIFLQETNINNLYTEKTTLELLRLEQSFCFFNYNTRKSNGTCILQTSNRWTVTFCKYSHEGRTTLIRISNGSKSKILINVYAPTNPTERVAYYDNLFNALMRNKKDDIVMAGDFNITLSDKDLIILYPDKLEYTFENRAIGRALRIDHMTFPV